MKEDIKKLNNIARSLKRMSMKVKLIKLISRAKQEYDSYDYKNAQKSLEEANKIDSKNPTVLRGLGCLKQFEQNYEEALGYFKKALKYSKNKELEYTLIGTVYFLQDNLEEALNYYNLAIDANESYEKAYEGRNQAMLENHVKLLDLQDALKKYF